MPESKLKIDLAGNFSEALKDLYNTLTKIDERLDTTAKAFNQFERAAIKNSIDISSAAKKIDKDIAKVEDTLEKAGKQGAIKFTEGIKGGFQSLQGIAQRAGGFLEKGFQAGVAAINAAKIGADFGKRFLDGVASQLQNLGGVIQGAGQNLVGSGTRLLIGGGLAGLIGSAAVGQTADFEQILRQVQVFGNLSAEALGDVQDRILQFSAETVFDPSQSISAFLDLQKAGLSAADSLEALNRIGELAAAGDQNLQDATEGLVLAVQSFGIAYEDATRITNAYVQAANAGTASVSELEAGVANVGVSAKNFGLSFEETVAVLSIFNDAGIRGAEAGTQLKTILTRLSSDNKEVTQTFADLGIKITDASGNLRSLDSILNDLRHRMNDVRTVTVQVSKGLGEDQKNQLELAEKAYASATRKIQLYELGLSSASEKSIQNAREIQNNASNVISSVTGSNEVLRTFQTEVQNSQIENIRILQNLGGSFGQLGLSTLINEDEDAIANFVTEMQKLPTAATIATQLMDTFKGSLDSLKGSLQTLLIKGLIPVMQKGLQPLIEFGIELVNGLIGLPEPILAGAAAFVVMTTAIVSLTGAGLILTGLVLQPIGVAITALGSALTIVTGMLFNPFGLIAAVGALSAGLIILLPLIGLMTAGMIAAIQIFNDIKNNVDGSRDSLERLIGSVGNLISQTTGLAGDILNFFSGISGASSDAETNLAPIVSLFDTIKTKIDAVVDGISQLRTFLQLIGAIHAEPQFDTTAAQGQLDALIEKRNQLTQDIVGGTGGKANTITVQPGQSFASIAASQGLSIEELIALNPQLGGQRPRVQPGDVFTVGMTVDASPALTELEAVNTEIEKIQTQLEFGTDDTAFLEKRAQLEDQIAKNRQLSNLLSPEDQAALADSTEQLQTQLDALNELGKSDVVDLFSEFEGTPLFTKLFGDEATLQDVRDTVADIDANFATLKDNVGLVANGFLALVSGDIVTGITDIATGFTNIGDVVEDIFQQVTGIDIGTGLDEKLAPFITFFEAVSQIGQAQFVGNVIKDIVALPGDLTANLSQDDIQNLEKLGNFLLAVGGVALDVGTRIGILSSGLIPLHMAIAGFADIEDIGLGLLDLIVSLSELDGEGVKASLQRIGEGIKDLFIDITTTGAQDIADVLGLDIDVDTVGETLDQLYFIMKAIFLKIERAILELDLKVGEGINSILRSFQKILDLGVEGLNALGLGDLANIQIGQIDLVPREVNLDVNTIKQQLLGGATAQDIIQLGVTGEVSFDAIEVAAKDNTELQAALDAHFQAENFDIDIGKASMILQQDAIDPETAAALSDQISADLQAKADAGELTPEIALSGLNVKSQLDIAAGETPELTPQEIDWVHQFGLDTIATPGGALDTAIKATGNQIVTGLDTGIKESETKPAQNMADDFQDTFNAAMLIDSPSQWMFERGLDLMQGLADGMADGMPLIQAAVDAIIQELMRIDQAIQELARRAQSAFFIIGTGMINASILFVFGANQMIVAVSLLQGKFKDLLWTLQNINAQLEGIVFNVSNINATGGVNVSGGTSTGGNPPLPPGLQSGGIGHGLALVGEAGRELISMDTRFAVLNNRTTEAFLAGANFFPQQPQPFATGTGGLSYADNRTIVVDARGSNLTETEITNAISEALRLADERALPFQKRALIAGVL